MNIVCVLKDNRMKIVRFGLELLQIIYALISPKFEKICKFAICEYYHKYKAALAACVLYPYGNTNNGRKNFEIFFSNFF